LADGVAGSVLCIETFEHVFEVRKAFDEVFRILKPGGLFVITSPLNFRIHGYPDDYWRMTPQCLRRMLAPYAARVVGFQGHRSFPHTVMALAAKAPAPVDFVSRAGRLDFAYQTWLKETEASLSLGQKLRRRVARVYRSKGERNQIAAYYHAELLIELAPALAQTG
ncbi:MAG TPA: methyltransferase domain-containing protein, partial [Isosphaeraceae bacterium]|nr:methyltransferase domain-containing protein [Isosphaeraceae bacterium]